MQFAQCHLASAYRDLGVQLQGLKLRTPAISYAS